ncbi:MAG TPA: hypothetical protein VHE30_25165 [Polyangiaceae bacterium]|nr:hypothetical protein [Polyangiaceae bacterium]
MIRTLFRGARFPDSEWWWHSVFVEAVDDAGRTRPFSIVTNVQLTGAPLSGECRPAAVVAIRDLERRETTVRFARGTLENGRAAGFFRRGWQLGRLDPEDPAWNEHAFAADLEPDRVRGALSGGAYVVHVNAEGLVLRLLLRQHVMARFGRRGWLDYDPRGLLPLWATSKMRLAEPTGTFRTGDGPTWTVTSGVAHFEQQCVLPSAMLPSVGAASLSAGSYLAESGRGLPAVPAWNWFRTTLPCGASLSAFVMWDSLTGRPMRRFAGLVDRLGLSFELPESDVEFLLREPRRVGETIVPRVGIVELVVPPGPHRVVPGPYAIRFDHDPETDFRVPYLTGAGLACIAHEAHSGVQVLSPGASEPWNTVGTHETIDLVASFTGLPE